MGERVKKWFVDLQYFDCVFDVEEFHSRWVSCPFTHNNRVIKDSSETHQPICVSLSPPVTQSDVQGTASLTAQHIRQTLNYNHITFMYTARTKGVLFKCFY